MTDTTAKIRSKGLEGTGFTEDLAASLFTRVGHSLKAIIELQVVDKHGPNLKGQRGIELVITQIEVASDSILEEHLREITYALYTNRDLQGHTGTTTAGQERTVADVISSGAQHRPHPFLPVDAAEDNPICDVCGTVEATAVHSTQDVLDGPDGDEPAGDDPDVDELTDEPSEDEVTDADPYDYVHAKGGSLPGEETICALHATVSKSLHTHDDHDQVTCPDCLEQLAIDASFEADDAAASTDATANAERHLASVSDPFTAPATT
jgi:hypothetical protein